MTSPPHFSNATTIDALLDLPHTLLIDAYGVLVHSHGPFPGAERFVQHLNASKHPYFIVTNDASKLPKTSSARLAERGLSIPVDKIITSGSLLTEWFADNTMRDAKCVVLGPEGSHTYVRDAGGEIVDTLDLETKIDALIVCDDEGFAFQQTIDATLSRLIQLFDAHTPPRLVLPNPDLIYPSGPDTFGITAGSIALIFETVLARRYPTLDPKQRTFERLGKPFRPIFREAQRRSQTTQLLMIGDQLATDILGAQRFGIQSALVGTGVTRLDSKILQHHDAKPTWILPHGLQSASR